MEKKKGAPPESAGSLGTPSNFEQNNTIFFRKIQGLVHFLVGTGAVFWLCLALAILGGLLT